VIFST